MSVCCAPTPTRSAAPWPAAINPMCSSSWSGRSRSTRCRATSSPSATPSVRRSTICRKRSVNGGNRATRPAPRNCRFVAEPSASMNGCWPPSSMSSRAICASCCCASPTCRIRMRPMVPATSTTRSSRARSTCRPSFRSTSGCRTGRRVRRSASSTTNGPRRSAGRCSPCSAAMGRRSLGRCASTPSIATSTSSRRSGHPRWSPRRR